MFLENAGDRNVYLDKFLSGNVSSNYVAFKSILDYVIYEYSWNVGLYKLTQFGLNFIFILNTISLSILFVFTYLVISKTKLIYVLFLINPLMLGLVFSQIRVALGFCIFIISVYEWRKARFIVGCSFALFACTIHTASIIFIAIYIALNIVEKLKNVKKNHLAKVAWCVGIALALSFIMGPMREQILMYLGDRRIVYPDMRSSFAYMTFWWGMLITLTLSQRRDGGGIAYMFTLVMLGTACFNQLFGFYSTRFLALVLPFMAVSVYGVRNGMVRIGLCGAYALYVAAQWWYWYAYTYKLFT